jgi:hypothetical protein
MLKKNRTGRTLTWGNFENNTIKRSHWGFTDQILGARLLQDKFREALMIFQNFRLPVVITMLMLGLFFAHSATAGYWNYTCKDGYQTSSSKGCNKHKGVKSKAYLPVCGDGIKDIGEVCDNGANNSDVKPNGCRTDCRAAYCGDGVIDTGEQCDDGSSNSNSSPNTCRKDCTLPFCGDGVVDDDSHRNTGKVFNEACDDGNRDDSDGCTTKCEQCLQLGQMGNIEITTDTDLCPAVYKMDDYGDYGAIIIKASGVTLDCHGATLIGEGRGVGIVNFRSNDVFIKNCGIQGYDVGIRIQDARNVTLQDNDVCGNRQRNVELIDATDINGYKPSMPTITACTDAMIQKLGKIPHAAMTFPSQAPKGQEAKAAPSTTIPASRTIHNGSPKASPAPMFATSAPSKQQRIHQSKSTAKEGTYSLYREAQRARWTSRSGKVVFGSDRVPNVGVARTIPKGHLANGSRAVQLLFTQPDWKKGGYIQGEFPALKFGKNAHFKTTVAMLKEARPSDTLSFDVMIQEGRRITVVKKQRLQGTKQVSLDVNLSRWSGKKVQLVLRVRYLKGAKTLPAVWVNPIVTSKE